MAEKAPPRKRTPAKQQMLETLAEVGPQVEQRSRS